MSELLFESILEEKLRPGYRVGGRIGFDRGGVAKVLAHLDSLPEGTDIDLEYIRKYIADNNIDAQPEGIFKQLEPNKINRKQISSAGNETFTYNKEKRDLLTKLNKKLNIKKLKEFVPATKENLEKLDNLIKNTDLNIEQIGKELGFRNPKSFKFAPTTKNVLVKEYIKKYGNPPEGRFRIAKLTPESKIVKEAIRLKDLGLSTNQVANELDIDRAAVVNYFRKGGREDLVGEVNVKKEGTPESRKKANRMANIKEGEKFASKADKAFNRAEDLRVKKINTFLKNNSDQLANNQKFIDLVNLKLDRKGNIISKNKSPEEITKLLKKDRLFERDHISSVAKRKRNMQFPVNFQMAPQNINQGFFGAAEAYVNRPDADPEKIKKISNVLDQYGLRLSTNKGIIGAKQIPASQVIDRNLSSLDLSTDIGKPMRSAIGKNLTGTGPSIEKTVETTKPSRIKTAFKAAKPVLKALPVIGTGIGLYDVNKALQAGITDPRDLYIAYEVSADVAAKNKRMREDPEFRMKEMAGLPAIMTEDEFEEDFTSPRNEGIVAVKGVI
tara:strand:+ start:61 stop:1725 length:1665 start_codon:yes stop_codon:yes gene_type:complete